MEKLVVYYSLDGNTEFIAKTIAKAIGADLLKLRPKKELQETGLSKFFWGGRQVTMKEEPELHAFDKHPEDYDLLFIGTPVWAWTFSPPLRTFFSSSRVMGKKIALFSCYWHMLGGTFKDMKKELAGNEIIGEMKFQSPLKDEKGNAAKASEWAKEIQKRYSEKGDQ